MCLNPALASLHVLAASGILFYYKKSSLGRSWEVYRLHEVHEKMSENTDCPFQYTSNTTVL